MSLLLAAGGSSYSLTALAGSYTLTGGSASLSRGRTLTALAGAYSLSGGSAVLTKSSAYTLTALAGSFTLSGGSASLSWSGESTSSSYTAEAELKPRKWYVKRRNQLYLFDSAEEADSFIAADDAADKAIQEAQKTSRQAKKRTRQKVYEATGVAPEQTISIDWVAHLVSLYGLPFDLPSIVAKQDYEELVRVALLAQQMQDEDDIEMLLLA